MSWILIVPFKLGDECQQFGTMSATINFAHLAEVTCVLSPKTIPTLAIGRSELMTGGVETPPSQDNKDVLRDCRRSYILTLPFANPATRRFPEIGSVMSVDNETFSSVFNAFEH
jgi:hypothetical protein